jgi:hypothetical protein
MLRNPSTCTRAAGKVDEQLMDVETAAFLEGGCALIIGTLSPERVPYATRGWSLKVLPDGPDGATRVRLLVDVDDLPVVGTSFRDGAVAVTGTDVPTLFSMQLKGRATGLAPATVADRERFERYCDTFFAHVRFVDRNAQVEHMKPADVSAVTITVSELYDQSPGPKAGTRLDEHPPAAGA